MAERNFTSSRTNERNSENIQINAVKLWRWRLMSKSYFYLGKLEEALVFLKKHADAISILDKYY